VTRRAILATSEETRDGLRRELLALRERLSEIASRMSREIGHGSGRSDKLVVDLVTEPVLEMPEALEGLETPRVAWLSAWPGLVERRIERALLSQLERPLSEAFHAFERKLRPWLRATLAGLAGQFAAQAEPLRALSRRAAEGSVSRDAEGLAADLRELEADPEPAAAAGRPAEPGAVPA
jgi:hypothetical protein